MASGTITKSFGQGYNIKINWKESSQSVANNTTTLAVTVTLSSTGSYHISSSASKNITLTVNGTKYTGTCNVGIKSSSTKTLMSKTVTIVHGSDGSKKVSLSATVGVNVSLSSGYVGNVTASGTATLTTIPRNSVITSAANVTLGNNVSITWTPATTSYMYRIHLTIVGNKGQWDYALGAGDNAIRPNTTSSYTYTNYQLPIDEIAALVTNSKTATCKATLYTYTSSNTQVGSSSSKNFTITIPVSASPVINSFDISMVNDNSTIAEWGVYVKDYSSVKMNCSASGVHGATISSYKYSYGNANSSSTSASYTGKLTSSGDVKVRCTVTDSRGYTATSQTITINNVYAYSRPTLDSFIASRNEKEPKRLDTYISYTYSSIGNRNVVQTTLDYKQQSSSSWSTYSGNIPNTTTFTIGDIEFDDTASYDIRIRVTDSLGNSSSYRTASITTREVLMDFYKGGKGLAIGKMCEGDGLEISMDTKFQKKVSGDGLLNYCHPIGEVYMTTVDTFDPNQAWGGTWEQIKDVFLLAAGDTYAGGTTGGEAEHTLNGSEIPPHRHDIYIYGSSGETTNVYAFTPEGYTSSSVANTTNSGGGKPHNNMPPYLAVYVWKRIA